MLWLVCSRHSVDIGVLSIPCQNCINIFFNFNCRIISFSISRKIKLQTTTHRHPSKLRRILNFRNGTFMLFTVLKGTLQLGPQLFLLNLSNTWSLDPVAVNYPSHFLQFRYCTWTMKVFLLSGTSRKQPSFWIFYPASVAYRYWIYWKYQQACLWSSLAPCERAIIKFLRGSTFFCL